MWKMSLRGYLENDSSQSLTDLRLLALTENFRHKGDIGRLASGRVKRVKIHQIAMRYTDVRASITMMT